MKAWGVLDDFEGTGVIVFETTRGKAKSLGQGHPGLDCCEWTDISVRRIPELDAKMDHPCVLKFDEHARLYWQAKWFPDVDSRRPCDHCERYHFPEIPESYIDDTGICLDCQARGQ